MSKKLNKIAAIILSTTLIFQQAGFAQVAAQLDLSSHFAKIGTGMTTDKFRPVHLRYLQYLPQDNSFKLLLDKGSVDPSLRGARSATKQSKTEIVSLPAVARNDDSRAELQDLTSTTQDLMKYFYIGLTLPNDTFWVNLRPDSPDNIIDQDLAKTDLGKILLEADLQLKKDTAQFTSPQSIEGKEYWSKLYKKAGELFGSDQITIPTLTRPWIVPGEIIVRESTDSAYIYKATLKVMLEEDYLKTQVSSLRTPAGGEAISKDYSFNDPRLKELNKYSTELIKELIIPKLTKEINSSKRYASLRQVYYSLIMAQWFKARFNKQSPVTGHRSPVNPSNPITQVTDLIDSRNLSNLISKQSWSKDTYFQAYKKSFAQGEYNLKEQVYGATGQTMRSYVSGGMTLDASSAIIQAETTQRLGFTFLSAGSPVGAAGLNMEAVSLPATPNYKEMFPKKLTGIERERRILSAKVSNALRALKPGDKVTIIIMEARLLTKDGMPKQEKDQVEGRVTKNEPDFSYFGNDDSFPRGRLTIDGISFPYSHITSLNVKSQLLFDRGVLGAGQDSPAGSLKQSATAASPVTNDPRTVKTVTKDSEGAVKVTLGDGTQIQGGNAEDFILSWNNNAKEKTGIEARSLDAPNPSNFVEFYFNGKYILAMNTGASVEYIHVAIAIALKNATVSSSAVKDIKLDPVFSSYFVGFKAAISKGELIGVDNALKRMFVKRKDAIATSVPNVGRDEVESMVEYLESVVKDEQKAIGARRMASYALLKIPFYYQGDYSGKQQVSSALTMQFNSYFTSLKSAFSQANANLVTRAIGIFLDPARIEMNDAELQKLEKYLSGLIEVDNRHKFLAEDFLLKLQSDDKYAQYFISQAGAASSALAKRLANLNPGDRLNLTVNQELPNGVNNTYIVEGVLTDNSPDFETLVIQTDDKQNSPATIAYDDVLELEVVASSSLGNDKSPGGIDFRALPIVSYASSALKSSIVSSPIAKLDNSSLSKEVLAIQKMVEAGIAPSEERIKDFVQASSALEAGSLADARQKAVLWIAEVLRSQEEECCASSAILKDMLVVLDSGVSEKELKNIFLGKG